MIPHDYITEWSRSVPWPQEQQVEQDLILGRALVEMFRVPGIAQALALRGGTALYKLGILPPARFSEDIDLVQKSGGPVGATLDSIRSVLDPWLGTPKRDAKEGRITMLYRFRSEGPPPLPMRLKVEMNSREHFSVLGYQEVRFEVRSRWFSGEAPVSTFRTEELLGTKMRALFQRKRARDLFDLWASRRHTNSDPSVIVQCFQRYLEADGLRVSRAEFEANLDGKLRDTRFRQDLSPVLAKGVEWDLPAAAREISEWLITRLPGEPWRGPEDERTQGARRG